MTTRIYIFKRFERFWHWAQALLIITMMTTGFEIHATYSLLGYANAVEVHTTAAWLLIGLWAFAIFWHFTTGEWKQYIPTTEKLMAMVRYYLTGIFTHAPHPFRQTTLSKHNPLQRLAYLFVKLMINPLIWISGLAYLYYNEWPAWLGLDLATVATIHVIAAFLMVIFFIVHIYFATTGHTVMSHITAMITGYEEVEDEESAKAPAKEEAKA
ncbi:MAG: cytochrome b/b6 domain-containing protein [Rhodospirillales bacterium]|nr:cytochrome b/b6 domain-containing protein [Rhodospirillales bacterium]